MTELEAKAFIDKLAQNKRAFVESGKQTGDWAGIERLVTEELYPDQSHFIFELLQNAEDAGATEVYFVLNPDRLSVWHDGLRLFSEKDAEGITGIGQTQKRDEVNQIGKFGVGFKSVFAYTKSPRIHSGNFHFEIHDLVVPSWVSPKSGLKRRFTYFHLPFNRPQKSPIDCFREIASGLNRLPESTILFLKNITAISWKISGKHEASMKRKLDFDASGIKGNGKVFHIRRRNSDGKATSNQWLRFDAPLVERPELSCSVAFLVGTSVRKDSDADSEEAMLASHGGLTIQPLSTPGHLHIYFPAGKEPTGLLFHIHAPFSATVDRASIPFDHPENQSLILEIAELCKMALEGIKEMGLLKSSFLAVLPNEKDQLQEFYAPIRSAIVEAFKERPLLPTHYGGFAKASDVVFGPKELRIFFSDQDLQLLKQQPNAVWCPGFRNSSRPDFFLDTLQVEAIEWNDFLDCWDALFRPDSNLPDQRGKSEAWLRKKMQDAGDQVDWLRSLYRLLLKADKETRRYSWSESHRALRESALVWTGQEKFAVGSRVYFQAASVAIPGISVEFANPKLFELSKAHPDKIEELRLSLKVLGVSEFDETSAIEEFVRKIRSQKTIPVNEHLEQLRCLLEWHTERKILDYSNLKTSSLFLDQEANHYRSPNSFYMDSPFRKTGLSLLYSHGGSIHALWPKYLDHFSADVVTSFAEAVGVRTGMPFVESRISWNHPEADRLLTGWSGTRETASGIDVDWNIEGLAELLERNDLETNRVLWNMLCECDSRYFSSKYRPNSTYAAKVGSSTLVHFLRGACWVHTKDGALCAAKDVSIDSIAKGWLTDTSNGWLSAVGFGQNAEKLKVAQIEREDAAEKLGITPDLANELATLSKDDQEHWLRRIRDARVADFPTESTGDASRRAIRAAELARKAKDVTREARKRNVRISSNREEARVYLEEKYTRDGDLFCQMSHSPMPFRLPSGRPFFESVEIFSLGKEIPSNHLCLSPTCAAEFRHALTTGDLELRERILAASIEAERPEVLIDVPLGEHCRVRFVNSHLIDLQAVLKSTDSSDDENDSDGNPVNFQ